MEILYALLFAIVLGSIFALGTYLNSKTPKPEGCEDLESECSGCKVTTCSHHPAQRISESNQGNSEGK